MGQGRDHRVEELALILGITHVSKFGMEADFQQNIQTKLEIKNYSKLDDFPIKTENYKENKDDTINVPLDKDIDNTESEYCMINDKGDKTVCLDYIQPFKCHKCKSVFKNDIGLSIHVSVKHGSGWREYVEKDGNIFRCKICQKTVKKKPELGKHISRVHKLGTTIVCRNCPQVFFYQKQLEDHMLVHSEERNFVCDICGINLKSANRVKAHKITRHMSEEEKLKRHEKFKCKICNKKYLHKVRLATHSESHGDRIYQCDECDTWFKTKDAKRAHSRKKHLGIKPKQLSEEEVKQKNENARLYAVKMRLKLKEINGGVLRKGEERINFNKYMTNRRAQKKASLSPPS